MKSPSKWVAGLGAIVAAVAIGMGIAWLATREPAAGTSHPAPTSTPTPAGVDTHPVHPLPGDSQPVATGTTQGGPGDPGIDTSPMVPVSTGTNWDDKLDEILGSETDDTNKLKQLFEMFPRLPAEGKVEVAQHLANLVEDDNYTPLGKLLEDAKQPEDVLDVLMGDLLNRPNEVKLPMFLEIAKSTDHPKAEEAKQLLELYLDEDYGTDWQKWDDKLKAWLKENPD